MRISVKGRYALIAMLKIAESYRSGEKMTVISVSETFGISKIYLEHVFSLLRRGGIVSSVKGTQGGYHLTQLPNQFTVMQILAAVEKTLFETTEGTVSAQVPEIELAMRTTVFDPLNRAVNQALSNITLDDILLEVTRQKSDQASMYSI
jgi:Rrf2 family protein